METGGIGRYLVCGIMMVMLLFGLNTLVFADHQGPPPNGGGFEQDDVNNEGKVTKDEFKGPDDLFDKLDANGDGEITKEEAKPKDGGPGDPPPQS